MHETMIFDFSTETEAWFPLDDGVMGGVSSSSMRLAEGRALFTGTVSLENNGGFASVRSMPRPLPLQEVGAIRLRVRGDGKRYQLRIRTSEDRRRPAYAAEFQSVAGEWVEPVLPLSGFVATWRGRMLPDEPPLRPDMIVSYGLLISGGQAGRFELEVAWIKGVHSAAPGTIL